jgi:hypothetical protein
VGGSSHDIGKSDFGFRDLFRHSTRIFIQHLRPIALVGFAIYLPIESLMVAIAPSDVAGLKDQFEIMQVEALFELLLGTVAALVVIRLTANEISGDSTRFGDVWKAAARRYFSTVATTIAMNMVFLGLVFLLVIPGLMGLVYMSFYLQVPALREETGFHALKHSKSVVEGHFWPVAGYSLLFLVSYELLASINTFVPVPWAAALLGAIGDVVNLYFVVAATVLYVHLDRSRFGYEE